MAKDKETSRKSRSSKKNLEKADDETIEKEEDKDKEMSRNPRSSKKNLEKADDESIEKEEKERQNEETSRVITVKKVEEYNKLLKNGLVIVDYNTVWCGPCKKFAPIFDSLSIKYPGIVFLSVDAEKIEHKDCEAIQSVPTFKVFLNGTLKREFSGVDSERLERYIKRYQVQIYFNGKVQRIFTPEDIKHVNSYMELFTNESE